MSDDGFIPEDHRPGYETLGPAYFAARRFAEKLFEGAEPAPFKDALKKAVDALQEQLYEYAEDHLLSDLKNNIQGKVARLVDDTVQALLTGEAWALEHYPLAKYHDGEAIRKAIAKHCGNAVLAKRVEELERECLRLRESLDYYTRR